MSIARFQLFEFNDLADAPASLRDSIVESLGRTLRWGRVFDRLTAPFETFLAEAGTRDVLDIASGSGDPAAILVAAIRKQGGVPPHFHLTDLHPRVEAWEAVRASAPDDIDFVRGPVDATAVPDELARGRARVVLNALHHLPPTLAQEVLLDGIRRGAGVFIAEGFERNPLGFLPLWLPGGAALLANPLLTKKSRLEKVALTWLTPAVVLAGLWDGFVSTLRVYTEAELREMVAPVASSTNWTYGTFDYPFGGRGYFFYGTRKA